MTREEAIRFGNLIIEIASQCDDEYNKHTVEFTELAVKALENQKTGHWIEHKIKTIRWVQCSECRIQTYNFKTHYCPNCGAKMKGENK